MLPLAYHPASGPRDRKLRPTLPQYDLLLMSQPLKLVGWGDQAERWFNAGSGYVQAASLGAVLRNHQRAVTEPWGRGRRRVGFLLLSPTFPDMQAPVHVWHTQTWT